MDQFFETMLNWLPELAAMLVLTAASGFFSSSETAIFCLSHDELRGFRNGRRNEQAVVSLLSDPDRLLTAILFWNLVINMTYFAVSVVLTQGLAEEGQGGVAALVGFASLIWIILFGEVLPKSGAVAFRKLLTATFSWPLAASVRVLDPLMPLFRGLTRAIRRAFWPGLKRESYLTPDDLEQAIDNSKKSDEVILQERQVLHNTLDLSEVTAEQAMRPRGTYLTLKPPISLDDLRSNNNGNVSLDFVAVANTDDTAVESVISIASFSNIPEHDLQDRAETVIHVPWCSDLAYTLQQIRENYCQMASVVNEYGETVGMVTQDDIIDNVLLAEPSRAARILKRNPIIEIDDHRYHVDGITSLRYLCRQLNIPYEPAADDAVTVAGLLQEQLERIPDVGDECRWLGLQIKVIDVTRPSRLRAMIVNESGRNNQTERPS